jgi:signal transduction histidine kinase/DNA-binding response OmpR family regulator
MGEVALTVEQLQEEVAALRAQVAALKASQADRERQRERLEGLLQECQAERMILELDLRARTREQEQAQAELERLQAGLELRVSERTAELERACMAMKQVDEIKDGFLSSVSHELRTPLTSIRSFSEILLQYEDVDRDQQKEFLGIINAESERLTRLINDVLDLSKIQAGRMTWHDDFMSLKEVIQYTVKAEQPLLAEKSLELELDLPGDLPLVFADRDRIQQIVVNLIGNAVKFSNPGGRIRVRVDTFKGRRAHDHPEWLRVSVSDQGIGIAKEDQQMIFEKFRQVTSGALADKPRGTGLGLPICKEILGHYQGNLWVESDKGKGSTFFFTLPAAPAQARTLRDTAAAETTVAGWRGRTVLVVDDNRNVRRLLRYQLQRRGYTVLEAASGQEALEVVKGAHVDLIILGLMMPVMSGYDFLEIVRDDPLTRAIPVLITSVVEDEGEGIVLGASDYLRKPFREADLMDKLRALLGEEPQLARPVRSALPSAVSRGNLPGDARGSILVVDDEVAVTETLCMQLEEKGFQVDVAHNGEEAIDRMKTQTPGLVILDLLMPKKNGCEVLNWVRREERTRSVPVIILSGCVLSADTQGLHGLGAGGAAARPDDLASLFKQIDTLLSPPASPS